MGRVSYTLSYRPRDERLDLGPWYVVGDEGAIQSGDGLASRARLPLFMHPRKRQWLRADDFKRVISKVLQRVHANVGIQLEDKEVLEMFNTHGARVAQQYY